MAGKPPCAPAMPAMPEFSSDRMRMLAPIITARMLDLARERIASGESYFLNDKLTRNDIPKGEMKIVLLLVLEMNPWEYLDTNERAILCSMDRGTFTKRLREGLIKL